MDPEIKLNENPLLWWKAKETQYPKLSKVAKKYLCASATSASSERVFSTAGFISKDRRNRISPDKLDKVVFLHKNMKQE